jgi:hypothetical protein
MTVEVSRVSESSERSACTFEAVTSSGARLRFQARTIAEFAATMDLLFPQGGWNIAGADLAGLVE